MIKSVEITSGVQLVVLVIYFLLTGYTLVDQAKVLIRDTIDQLHQPVTMALARIGSECFAVLLHIMGYWGRAGFNHDSFWLGAGRAVISDQSGGVQRRTHQSHQ